MTGSDVQLANTIGICRLPTLSQQLDIVEKPIKDRQKSTRRIASS